VDPKIKLTLPAAEQREIFSKPVVCIHPASGTEMRQWPPDYFGELIDLLVMNYDLHVVILGGPDEMDIAQKVLNAVRHPKAVHCLVGKLKLTEVPTLISKCTLFVGNNSGPHHIAGALGVPTIGVHSGVVDSMEWGPLGDNAVAIRRNMSCSPCYIEKRGDCPKNLACIRGLGPYAVYEVAAKMLAIGGAGAAAVRREPPALCASVAQIVMR
jgi:ADP-heptose:LPS heptosyltransferase